MRTSAGRMVVSATAPNMAQPAVATDARECMPLCPTGCPPPVLGKPSLKGSNAKAPGAADDLMSALRRRSNSSLAPPTTRSTSKCPNVKEILHRLLGGEKVCASKKAFNWLCMAATLAFVKARGTWSIKVPMRMDNFSLTMASHARWKSLRPIWEPSVNAV